MNRRPILAAVVLILALAMTVAAQQIAKKSTPNTATTGDFFIISSVDLAKQQLLLKRPTEVTEVMSVDDNTHYFDEHGKAIQLAALRAGDTIYIQSTRRADGALAQSIRLGPMTVEELHRRYLNRKN
jgi:hypothetical protein